ncbi:hypothetical protein [Streptomyces sp. NPDC015350]|uniref:hypothetical protein n=1 Tax=Streptomyces sp. NPDC015350 TaxID=3364955 RepID=UPI0036F8A1DF
MASRSEPKTMTADGRPVIVLSEQEYEALVSSRRQLGSQAARLKKVREALFDVVELAESLGTALVDQRNRAVGGEGVPVDVGADGAVVLLREAHRRLDRARRAAGVRTSTTALAQDGG